MSFKVMNPGLPRLWGITNVGWIWNTKYNPINGVVFNSQNRDISLYSVPSSCNEVWIKAGIYISDMRGDYNTWFCINTGSYRHGIHISNYKMWLMANNTKYSNCTVSVAKDQYLRVLIHVVYGSNGYVEVFVDGKRIGIYRGNVTKGDNTLYMCNYASYVEFLPSNFIISDTEIKTSEEVYILSAKTTETDMTESTDSDNNLIFMADTAEQTLLRTIDTDALSTKIGSTNIKVTNVGIGAAPIYYEGEGLSHVAFMMNDIEQEVQEITTSTEGGICFNHAVDYNLEDLKTLKLGFRAKE